MKTTRARKATVSVRDVKTKANPKGGITPSTAPTATTGFKVTGPPLTAKGNDVAMQSLVIAKEGLDIT